MISKASIHYSITPARPEAHIFTVSLQILHPDPAGQLLRLPAWIPGSYMIRDFAKHVVTLKATDVQDRPVEVRKVDKSTWRLPENCPPVKVEYEVYAFDFSVRAAWLDNTRAFFNGTSVFLEVVGQADRPCTVDIHPPPRGAYRQWKVATTLSRAENTPRYAFGRYHAEHYDALIDHPVEIADFDSVLFDVNGIRHEFVLSGWHEADLERLQRDVQRICEAQQAFFSGPFPADEYLFMTAVSENTYGGLEHRASTALMCPRKELPRKGDRGVSDDYLNYLTLISHEYFHTWNVKQMKPAAFIPYDLSREVHTELLWVFEGATVYYEALPLVRCGLIGLEQYLVYLGETLSRAMRGSGKDKQSPAESSFDTWTKFYKQDENAPNAIVSYYTRGAMAVMALDLYVRLQTRHALSLDHVMRAMWKQWQATGQGLPERGFEKLIREVTGVNVDEQVRAWVYGTETPPLAELLQPFGIEYTLRLPRDSQDRGGRPLQVDARPFLGALVRATEKGQARLAQVWEGGAAMQAGLSAGDLLLSVDGQAVTATTLEAFLATRPLGREVEVHFLRDGRVFSCRLPCQPAEADRVVLTPAPNVDSEQLENRKSWLNC